ncbi:MAG: hypothetical protein FJX71_02935 [Alphaproteobacteria bacterium]|nr:hypothetical protein [Alphaproteobacteria bacterium]
MEESIDTEHKHKVWLYEIYNDKWMFLYSQFLNNVNSNIKLLFIVNSGTIISLLTFAGHQPNLKLFSELRISFVILMVGVICAVLSSISEMRRQDIALGNFHREWIELFRFNETKNISRQLTASTRAHFIFNILAWIFGIIAFLAFVSGTILSVCILSAR